jgi:hypothetical protein
MLRINYKLISEYATVSKTLKTCVTAHNEGFKTPHIQYQAGYPQNGNVYIYWTTFQPKNYMEFRLLHHNPQQGNTLFIFDGRHELPVYICDNYRCCPRAGELLGKLWPRFYTPCITQPRKIKASTVTGIPSDRPRNRSSVPKTGQRLFPSPFPDRLWGPTQASGMKPSSYPSLSCEVKNVWSCTSTRLGVVRKHKDISHTPLFVLSTSAQPRTYFRNAWRSSAVFTRSYMSQVKPVSITSAPLP